MAFTGFNYDLGAINPLGNPNPLNEAVATLFHSVNEASILGVFQQFIPLFRYIVRPSVCVYGLKDIYECVSRMFQTTETSRRAAKAQKAMRDIGLQLIAEKKASILADNGSIKPIGKGDVFGRDLLTLLIKANMASDIPESQRMTDDEVLARKHHSFCV